MEGAAGEDLFFLSRRGVKYLQAGVSEKADLHLLLHEAAAFSPLGELSRQDPRVRRQEGLGRSKDSRGASMLPASTACGRASV